MIYVFFCVMTAQVYAIRRGSMMFGALTPSRVCQQPTVRSFHLNAVDVTLEVTRKEAEKILVSASLVKTWQLSYDHTSLTIFRLHPSRPNFFWGDIFIQDALGPHSAT